MFRAERVGDLLCQVVSLLIGCTHGALYQWHLGNRRSHAAHDAVVHPHRENGADIAGALFRAAVFGSERHGGIALHHYAHRPYRGLFCRVLHRLYATGDPLHIALLGQHNLDRPYKIMLK